MKPTVLNLTRRLIDELDRGGVRFCHWKSNASLDQAMQGVGDLDLLVDSRYWPIFSEVVTRLGFVAVQTPNWQRRRDAHHYYGFDEPTGRLVHLDVYDRLLTGGTLLKNHHLPLEEMLFGSLRRQGAMPVPSNGAELLLLVIRKSLESASLPEHVLLLREYEQVLGELQWLDHDAARAEARALLERWVPMVDQALFERCRRALGSRGSVFERWLLGQRLARELGFCEILPGRRAALERASRLARWLLQRLGGGARGSVLRSGGAVIAFIGPEASGKSTMVAQTSAWLRPAFQIHAVHAGKPPSSAFTAVPNLLAPTLRRLLPRYRTTFGQPKDTGPRRGFGFWFYALRCLGLAFDRWLVLHRADRLRAGGAIVVCDRYPMAQPGFVDGAMLDGTPGRGSVRRRLAGAERRLYAQIPRPDLLIVCQVPLAEALRRNRARQKHGGPEPDALVRLRHAQFASLQLDGGNHVLDTTQSVERTQRAVRRLVWEILQR